ncbi:TRAF-type zinc finger domain containing 1 [Chamberlinius hualienensis]
METTEGETQFCDNCKKSVSKLNYPLHSVHCIRNISLCKICHEPYPRSEIKAHIDEAHAKITCDKCGKEIEKQAADKHQSNECPKRLIKCHICELELAECDMDNHIDDYCGSRTEKCETCGKYVMLKFMDIHLSSNHAFLTMDGDQPAHSVSAAPPPPNYDEDEDFPYPTSRLAMANVETRLPLATNSFIDDTEFLHGRAFDDLIYSPMLPGRTNVDDFNRILSFNPPFPSLFPNITGNRRPIITEDDDDDDLRVEDFGGPVYTRLDDINREITTRSNIRSPLIIEQDDRIPCEFCGELYDFNLLSAHQEACEEPPPNFRTATRTIPIDITQREDLTLIPCEYCNKPFDSEIIIEHQTGCDKIPQQQVQPQNGFDLNARIRTTPPATPANTTTAIMDDDDYINDLFLKEAIENSLKEKEANDIANLSSERLPKVRNVPIRLLSSNSQDARNDHRLVGNGSTSSHLAAGTRPKNEFTGFGSSLDEDKTTPKPPLRRHSKRDGPK